MRNKLLVAAGVVALVGGGIAMTATAQSRHTEVLQGRSSSAALTCYLQDGSTNQIHGGPNESRITGLTPIARFTNYYSGKKLVARGHQRIDITYSPAGLRAPGKTISGSKVIVGKPFSTKAPVTFTSMEMYRVDGSPRFPAMYVRSTKAYPVKAGASSVPVYRLAQIPGVRRVPMKAGAASPSTQNYGLFGKVGKYQVSCRAILPIPATK